MKKIQRILVSVYNKNELLPLINMLFQYNPNLEIVSTGGTQKFLEDHNLPVTAVEEITNYPSILGGRVKTLHPKIFGGILNRSDNNNDHLDLQKFNIPNIDVVVVDLYPFQETLKNTSNHTDIIEKIDIGGVSLIRSAAKNYNDSLVVPAISEFDAIMELIKKTNGYTSLNDRLIFAQKAFKTTSEYELAICDYFNQQTKDSNQENLDVIFNHNNSHSKQLRYGENPHQKGTYYGELKEVFEQLNGKDLSYNNLLDIDAAINLMNEFDETSFGIFKHNNACGFASHNNVTTAWKKALAGDPISAFGGVLISNTHIDNKSAKEINNLFFEILIGVSFSDDALKLLKTKKNRIILIQKKNTKLGTTTFRTVLNGVLCQEKDNITDDENGKIVSNLDVTKTQMADLIFASKICKHTKSNAIVLVKNKQLLGSGCGQTSRVDALKQAILKAKKFGFSLDNAVMASDAFFPFPDCVEIAHKEGVRAIIQPGGSKKDQLSIEYCNINNVSMVFTGNRHFKH